MSQKTFPGKLISKPMLAKSELPL